jgi:hypothetical protein
MFLCPNCRTGRMSTNNPNNAHWVALGVVVCSQVCHAEMYERPFQEAELQLRSAGDEQYRLRIDPG